MIRSRNIWASRGLARFWRSFEFKVVGLCLVTTVSALVLAFAAFQWQDWNADHADLRGYESALAQRIAAEAARADGPDGVQHLALAGALARGSEETRAAVWYPSGGGRQPLMGALPDVDALQPSDGSKLSAVFSGDRLIVHAPYVENGRQVGEVVLSAHDHGIAEKLGRNNIIAIAFGSLATLISALLAGALARRGLRPLYALDRGIQAVRLGRDFKARVEVISNDEFGRLSENFNALLTDLQTYDGRLQQTMDELTGARDAAEEANAHKSQFLANMSHEIRTPLNGVLGMAQVMGMGDLARAQRERLEVIQASGAALLAILNDILDLSKIESGQMQMEAIPFDLAEAVGAACDVFKPLAESKGLAFEVMIAPAVQGLWRGDPVRVRQLVQNLISNALKFTSEGAVRVKLEAPDRGGDKGVVIRVADSGIGMTPAAASRVFEKFTQADASTTRRFGGTGLGLTICREIAQRMGGEIDVSSREGLGSTFEARLPLTYLGASTTGATSDPDAFDPAVDLAGLKILAADDNATNQLVIRTLLEAFGAEPTVVGDGEAAVAAWRDGDFDLVLMDIQMPGLDGVEATREIRRLEAKTGRPRTPVVALSANAMDDQIKAYLEAGLDAHLAKPIVVSALHAVLARVVAGQAPAVAAA